MSLLHGRWLILLMVATIAGCGSRPRGGGADGRASLINPMEARQVGYAPRWNTTLALPRGEDITHAEVLGDLIVTVEAPSNLVTAMRLRDGEIIWQREVGRRHSRLFHPFRRGDVIYVNSENQVFGLAASSGAVTRLGRLDYPVETGPGVVEDLAIFGSAHRRVFAHHIDANASRWSYEMSAAVRATPTPADNNIVVADANGVTAMLNGITGEPLWRRPSFGAILARPAVSADAVYVASEDQSLYSYNRVTGRDRWAPYRAGVRLREDPVVLETSLYLPVPGRGLVSINPDTGRELWVFPERAQPILLREQRLLVNTGRSLAIVDNATGGTLARASTERVQRVLTGPDNSIILIAPDGRVERLDPLP